MDRSEFFKRTFFFLLAAFSAPTAAKAGLDHFSYLDQVDNWVIERRIDSKENTVKCRAYLRGNATWFGARIRLDRNDELLIPEDLKNSKRSSPKMLAKVKQKLYTCRSGLIYLIEESSSPSQ